MLSLYYTQKTEWLSDGSPEFITRQVLWHVGEDKPKIYGAIYSIQADGHELEYIHKNFGNIPMAFRKEVVLYHNPYAQFIWDNL